MSEQLIYPDMAEKLSASPATSFLACIPLSYNDGSQVDQTVIDELIGEISDHMGGCTCYPPGVGLWIDHTGHVYRDTIGVVQTVASDPEAETFLRDWAVRSAKRLEQVGGIFILSHDVAIREPTKEADNYTQPELPFAAELAEENGVSHYFEEA